jgi:hypothetical protein
MMGPSEINYQGDRDLPSSSSCAQNSAPNRLSDAHKKRLAEIGAKHPETNCGTLVPTIGSAPSLRERLLAEIAPGEGVRLGRLSSMLYALAEDRLVGESGDQALRERVAAELSRSYDSLMTLMRGSPDNRAALATLAGLAAEMAAEGRLTGLELPERVLRAGNAIAVTQSLGRLGDAATGTMPVWPKSRGPYDAAATAALYYVVLTHPGLTGMQRVFGLPERPDPGAAATAAYVLAGLPYLLETGPVAQEFVELVKKIKGMEGERGKVAAEALSAAEVDALMDLIAELRPEKHVHTEFLGDEAKAGLTSPLDLARQQVLEYYYSSDWAAVMPALVDALQERELVNMDGGVAEGAIFDPFNDRADYLKLAAVGLRTLDDRGPRSPETRFVGVPPKTTPGNTVEIRREVVEYFAALVRAGLSHDQYRAMSRRVFGVQRRVENYAASLAGDGVVLSSQRVSPRAVAAATAAVIGHDTRSKGLAQAVAEADFASLKETLNNLANAGVINQTDRKKLEDHRGELAGTFLAMSEILARAAEINGFRGQANAIRALASRAATGDIEALKLLQNDAAAMLQKAAAKATVEERVKEIRKAQYETAYGLDEMSEADRKDFLDHQKQLYGRAAKGDTRLHVFLSKLFRDASTSTLRGDGSQHRVVQASPRAATLVEAAFPHLLAKGKARPGQAVVGKLDEFTYAGVTTQVVNLDPSARIALALRLSLSERKDGTVDVVINPSERDSLYVMKFDAEALDKEAAKLLNLFKDDVNLPADARATLEKGGAEARFMAAQWAINVAVFGDDIVNGKLSPEGVREGGLLGKNDAAKRQGLASGQPQAEMAGGQTLKVFQISDVYEIVTSPDGEETPVALPKTASDGFQYGILREIAQQLGVEGGAFKIGIIGTDPLGAAPGAGREIKAAKPAGIPAEFGATHKAAMELADSLVGEEGNFSAPVSWGPFELYGGLAEQLPAEFRDMILDAGASKVLGKPIDVGPVTPYTVRAHDRKFKVYGTPAWFNSGNVVKTSSVAGDARRYPAAFGVSSIKNVGAVAPDPANRIMGWMALAAKNLNSMPKAELQRLVQADLVRSAGLSTPAAAYVASAGGADHNFLLDMGYAAASLVRNEGRLTTEALHQLLIPSAQPMEVALSGRGAFASQAGVNADGSFRPARAMLNDSRPDAMFGFMGTDAFERDFSSPAAAKDKIKWYVSEINAMRELRGRLKPGYRLEQTKAGVSAKNIDAAVAEAKARIKTLVEFNRKYIRDYTGVQSPLLTENVSGFFDADGDFRNMLIQRIEDSAGTLRWGSAPINAMFERFPGATGMAARNAFQTWAPAGRDVGERFELQADGTVKKVRRIVSGDSNLMIMDPATANAHDIDHGTSTTYVLFSIRPTGTAPSSAELRKRASKGTLSAIDKKWMAYFVTAEFIDALLAQPLTVLNASLDRNLALDVLVPTPIPMKKLSPELFGDREMATIKEIDQAKLHPMAALHPEVWLRRGMSAADSGDRAKIACANEGMAVIATHEIDISAEDGKFGESTTIVPIFGEGTPYQLDLGRRGSDWQPTEDNARAIALRQVSYDLGNDLVQMVINSTQSPGGYAAGITCDTINMALVLAASWIPKFTAAEIAQKKAELGEGYPEWARQTPGTKLNFLQSWANAAQTDPGLATFVAFSKSIRLDAKMQIPKSWRGWEQLLQRNLETSKKRALFPRLDVVRKLFGIGEQIQRLSDVSKQHHNLPTGLFGLLCRERDREGIRRSTESRSEGRRLEAKEDSVPVFPNLNLENVASGPFMDLQEQTAKAFGNVFIEAGIFKQPVLLQHAKEIIRNKHFEWFVPFQEAVERSVATSAVLVTFPPLMALLNDVVLPFYRNNGGVPEEIAKAFADYGKEAGLGDSYSVEDYLHAEKSKDELAAARAKAKDKFDIVAYAETKAREISFQKQKGDVQDMAAAAMALEAIASQVFVSLMANGEELLARHAGLYEDFLRYFRTTRMRKSEYSRGGWAPMEKNRHKLVPFDIRITADRSAMDLAAFNRVLDRLEIAMNAEPLILSVPRWPRSSRIAKMLSPIVNQFQAELSSGYRKNPALGARLLPMTLPGGALNKLGVIEKVGIVPINGTLVRPLLAYFGVSRHGSNLAAIAGNPTAYLDGDTLQAMFRTYKSHCTDFANIHQTIAFNSVAMAARESARHKVMTDFELGTQIMRSDIPPLIMANGGYHSKIRFQ